MDKLNELYQELILDHNKHPKNFGKLANPSSSACGHNPLCGDRVEVYLRIENNKIAEASFEGVGCAISRASASLMMECIQGKTLEEVEKIFNIAHQMFTKGIPEKELMDLGMDNLKILAQVRRFPIRVKCASLAWHTLHSAMIKKEEPVSTE